MSLSDCKNSITIRNPATMRPCTYMFHIHTDHTDGKVSVSRYFELAYQYHVEHLIFLEHIRTAPTYDVLGFVQSIEENSYKFGLHGVVGFEARILPGGVLDIAPEHLLLADFVGIAEHSFEGSAASLWTSFRKIVRTYPINFPEKTFVWVHPGLWFSKRDIYDSFELMQMMDEANRRRILVELNLRYDLPKEPLFSRIVSKKIIGIDAHHEEDIHTSWKRVCDSSF